LVLAKEGNAVADSSSDSHAADKVLEPQRNSRWTDLLVLALIVLVLLGGVGKAFSDSDLFSQAGADAASATEACPQGGCVKPPEELCNGRAVKAIAGLDGQRLYYTGEHPGYQGIIAIHVERGDRWFCTPDAAAANGFVPAP
jgi:hypothetical protein